jgi:hypothetical protein
MTYDRYVGEQQASNLLNDLYRAPLVVLAVQSQLMVYEAVFLL